MNGINNKKSYKIIQFFEIIRFQHIKSESMSHQEK